MGDVQVGAHPGGVHGQAVHQRGRVGRRARGQPQGLAQRLPLRVPGTGGPLVLGGHRGEQNRGQRGQLTRRRDDERGPDGVGLVRHRGRAAARALGQFADLRAREHEHVGGELAQRAADQGQRRAQLRDGGAQHVPGQQRPIQSELVREPVREGGALRAEGGQGSGRAAELRGQLQCDETVAGVQCQAPPAGRLQSEAGRHRVLGQCAAGQRRVPVHGGEDAQPVGDPLQIGAQHGPHAGGDEHGRGVEDVLARRAAVHGVGVLLGHGGAQVGDEGEHRVAPGPGAQCQREYVEVLGPVGGPRHRVGGVGGHHAEVGLRARQRRLRVEHGAQERGVTGERGDGGAGADRAQQPHVGGVEGRLRGGVAHGVRRGRFMGRPVRRRRVRRSQGRPSPRAGPPGGGCRSRTPRAAPPARTAWSAARRVSGAGPRRAGHPAGRRG